MRLVASLFAVCLLLAGFPGSGAVAAPIVPVPALQELIAMGTPDAAPKKTRTTKAAEKSKASEAAGKAADTTTTIAANTPEGASGTAREAPSAGSGDGALQASSGTQSAPPHTTESQTGPTIVNVVNVTSPDSSADGHILAEAAAALGGQPPAVFPSETSLDLAQHIFAGALVVSGPPEGRRRAGRRFGPTPTTVRAEDLTSEQLAGLYADPLLTIRAT